MKRIPSPPPGVVPDGFQPLSNESAYSAHIGPVYEHSGREGPARRGFFVQPQHINNGGIAHGGMLMSFADLTLAWTVRRAGFGPGVTVRMTTDFQGPARLGDWVEGVSRIVEAKRSLIFVDGEIFANGRLILSANGLFRRVRERG